MDMEPFSCETHQNMSVVIAKKVSIDERSFLQFIIALRQIKASPRAAEDNVSHFEVG